MADLTRAHAVLLTIRDVLDATRLPASRAFAEEDVLESLHEVDQLVDDYFGAAPSGPLEAR